MNQQTAEDGTTSFVHSNAIATSTLNEAGGYAKPKIKWHVPQPQTLSDPENPRETTNSVPTASFTFTHAELHSEIAVSKNDEQSQSNANSGTESGKEFGSLSSVNITREAKPESIVGNYCKRACALACVDFVSQAASIADLNQ